MPSVVRLQGTRVVKRRRGTCMPPAVNALQCGRHTWTYSRPREDITQIPNSIYSTVHARFAGHVSVCSGEMLVVHCSVCTLGMGGWALVLIKSCTHADSALCSQQCSTAHEPIAQSSQWPLHSKAVGWQAVIEPRDNCGSVRLRPVQLPPPHDPMMPLRVAAGGFVHATTHVARLVLRQHLSQKCGPRTK